jgi:flavorubredoxin
MPVYKLFAVINPLRDKGKPSGSFGSYGWSGEAPGIIAANLKNLKLSYFENPASFKFSPASSKSDSLREYGRRFAQFVISEYEKKGE